jgi:hypothetical protein
MELKDYIRLELENLSRTTSRVIDTLTYFELMWRPAPGCNSIGLILFHTIKSEDMMVHSRILGTTPLWEAEKWYEKLNMQPGESGNRYTIEQVAAFPVPKLENLQAFATRVREQTLTCLNGVLPAQFDRVISTPRGDTTVGGTFVTIAAHTNQHIGEMSYLRGLQRGIDR